MNKNMIRITTLTIILLFSVVALFSCVAVNPNLRDHQLNFSIYQTVVTAKIWDEFIGYVDMTRNGSLHQYENEYQYSGISVYTFTYIELGFMSIYTWKTNYYNIGVPLNSKGKAEKLFFSVFSGQNGLETFIIDNDDLANVTYMDNGVVKTVELIRDVELNPMTLRFKLKFLKGTKFELVQ